MQKRFVELQIMNLSDSSEPDTPPDSEGTARSSVLSEDEDPSEDDEQDESL